jgi:hypothetical protein
VRLLFLHVDLAVRRYRGAAVAEGRGLRNLRLFVDRTTSLPWLIAAGARRTALLITTVPVRLLTITRAGVSAG